MPASPLTDETWAGLPLLQMLARGEAGQVCLDYLPPMQLNVDLKPC